MGRRSKTRAHFKGVARKAKWEHEIDELLDLADCSDLLLPLHGELDEIKKVIVHGNHAAHLTPEGCSGLLHLLSRLSSFQSDRFDRLGEPGDLDKAIEYGSRAVELTSDTNEEYPSWLAKLGSLYYNRYGILKKSEDLASAIQYETRAVQSTPKGHSDLPLFLSRLSRFHYNRYWGRNEPGDLDTAIEHLTHAVDLTPETDEECSDRFEKLMSYHYTRYGRLNKLEDLEKAIECGNRAVQLTPKGHSDLPYLFNRLSHFHSDRFKRLGELGDLEKAVDYATRSVDLTPSTALAYPLRLAKLGTSYCDRYKRLGKSGDVEKAIEYGTRAVDLTPDGHPGLRDWLDDLGSAYKDRFERRGELNDLEEAIKCQSRALASTPDGHSNLPLHLGNLGLSYHHRFLRLGDLDDLTLAIEHQSRAIALTPGDCPNKSTWYNNLGSSYFHRFDHLNELDDLQKAVEFGSRAVESIPDGHPLLRNFLNNLGLSYCRRSMRLGDPNDLEKAIECGTRAVNLTPEGDPLLAQRLGNLGMAYGAKSAFGVDLDDLKKKIELASRALDLTPDDHPDLTTRLNNLGVAYHTRFQLLGDLEDLKRSIELGARAIASAPDGYPQLPMWYFNHADAWRLQYVRTNDPAAAKNALDYFRKASHLSTGAPRLVFHVAFDWAKSAFEHSSLNCMEAYQVTVDLLPQFIWLGATTHQRYSDIVFSGGFAMNAAYAAICYSEYTLALEWLEHTRCVVWNQSLALRSPLDQLHASYPDLSDRLQEISRQLQGAASDLPESRAPTSGSVTIEHTGKQRHRLAKEYKSLLAEARALPGFQDFLQPMKAKGLMRAARYGPIVAINCHSDRCDALIILPGQDEIKHLPLPDFNREKARKARSVLEMSLRRKGFRDRGLKAPSRSTYQDGILAMLRDIWKCVVKPIFDSMGLTNDVPVGDLTHITWCPTGPLSFLPLHAAGDYDQPRSRVFDYAISSYTPTLTALLASTPTSVTRRPRVLAVGQANAPGLSPLPGTATELASLKTHTENKAEYSQLIDDAATTTSVLDAMEQHDWVHLACHAHQNVTDSTQSGFHLHDGTLDLAAINKRSFKNKGLAFLSACQTATGDEKLPDEAVHLASGMLMAGYPSVIATMWSVVDDDAPFVADRVYAELLKDGKIGNGEAGRALHHAVAALRDKVGAKEFGRWVPYIHIGS